MKPERATVVEYSFRMDRNSYGGNERGGGKISRRVDHDWPCGDDRNAVAVSAPGSQGLEVASGDQAACRKMPRAGGISSQRLSHKRR